MMHKCRGKQKSKLSKKGKLNESRGKFTNSAEIGEFINFSEIEGKFSNFVEIGRE